MSQLKKFLTSSSTNSTTSSKSSAKSGCESDRKISDLEAKVNILQRTLKEKERAIVELRDKTFRQEKKIDDQTRAKSVRVKDATVMEIKERIMQQKKDDVTRARLAHSDSPVTKAVLDATLKENKDLRLRIEAMQLEEKKTMDGIAQTIEGFKRELAMAESKNEALEEELQAAKLETLRIQRQFSHIRDSVSSSHSVPHGAHSGNPSTSTYTLLPPISFTPCSTIDTNNTHTAQLEHDNTDVTQSDTMHVTFINSTHDAGSPIQVRVQHIEPSDELITCNLDVPHNLPSIESYDLNELTEELRTHSLQSSDSLLDLVESLSPMQTLGFISLAHDKNDSVNCAPAMSPTARMEMKMPFVPITQEKINSEYDKDFIEMFNPLGSPINTNSGRVKVRQNILPWNNLFYNEDRSFPPTCHLDGIEDAKSPATSPPPIIYPSKHLPTSNSDVSFSLHDVLEDYTPSQKGVRKSIFSVFGSQNENGDLDSNDTSSNSVQLQHGLPGTHKLLLLSFGSKVDTNKAGLRRAKKVNFASFNKGKVKIEPTMEDVHFCIFPYMKSSSRALFAVFDGHAGRAAADKAAMLFPVEFNNQLDLCSQDVTSAFIRTYAAVDEAMKEYEYMGTTATVVYLWERDDRRFIQTSNVGDSTAYLCQNGEAVKLTVDHKPSLLQERERMQLAGVEVSDNQTRINGLAVSRSLGNHFVKEQNIGMISAPYIGDCIEILPTFSHLIIASDGLWDVVTAQNAMELTRGMEALPAASLLLSTALASPKCNDNVSIIVVCLN